MVTEERGTSKAFARKSMQASLARPSTGGAVRASFRASPISPVMPFFLARGWTLTANVAPDGESLMGITRTSTAEAWRHGEFLEECSLPSPRTLRLYYRSEEHTSELQSPCNLVC